MSYFDGKIPACCRSCFYLQHGQWVQRDIGLCDECSFLLEMFPVIFSNCKIDHQAMELLRQETEPNWSL